jgi:hypothetical protein
MARQHGRLLRQQREGFPIDFTPHNPTVGHDPAYFELHDLPEPLEDDELVVLISDGEKTYTCRAIDSTNMCAYVPGRDSA